jgi:hypothetical protein
MDLKPGDGFIALVAGVCLGIAMAGVVIALIIHG